MHQTCVRIATITVTLFAGLQTTRGAERPNVIVIFSDDHGYTDLSCQGIAEDVRTPHIDALIRGGVRMTSGYVSAPQCVPSRAGLLTGRYQNRFGVESNGEPLDGFGQQQSIAERLKSAGYATGMTGKWHLGPQQQIVNHGFTDVYYKNSKRAGWANFNLDGSDREPGPEASELYHLDANSAAACAFIRRHHRDPFFFYCAYRAPHVPLDAPPKYLRRFPDEMPERRRQALAMISAMDDGVGQIVKTLREFKLEEKTLIFFIGDNGAPLKIHKIDAPGSGAGWDGSLNEPLNGEKGMLSEGGIRVPFVVSWPGHIKGGRDYDHPVISLDVAATALALAGVSPDPLLDGVNLIPFLTGNGDGAPHAQLFWRWVAQSAVREGKWKLLRGGEREYLFDLEADPEEKRNLAKQHPEIVNRLRPQLSEWADGLQPPGLATRAMSETWTRYYDHYLDGKPQPRPTASTRPRGGTERVRGWVGRNGRLSVRRGALSVLPERRGRRPFIAASGLKLPPNARATIRLQAAGGGAVGIAWRQDGQKDFPAGQVVQATVPEGEDWHEATLGLTGTGPIVHIRLLLPETGARISSILLHDDQGRVARKWTFDE